MTYGREGMSNSRVPSFLPTRDRKSTRLNSSHGYISYAVFCLKKKNKRRVLHDAFSSAQRCYLGISLYHCVMTPVQLEQLNNIRYPYHTTHNTRHDLQVRLVS